MIQNSFILPNKGNKNATWYQWVVVVSSTIINHDTWGIQNFFYIPVNFLPSDGKKIISSHGRLLKNSMHLWVTSSTSLLLDIIKCTPVTKHCFTFHDGRPYFPRVPRSISSHTNVSSQDYSRSSTSSFRTNISSIKPEVCDVTKC